MHSMYTHTNICGGDRTNSRMEPKSRGILSLSFPPSLMGNSRLLNVWRVVDLWLGEGGSFDKNRAYLPIVYYAPFASKFLARTLSWSIARAGSLMC